MTTKFTVRCEITSFTDNVGVSYIEVMNNILSNKSNMRHGDMIYVNLYIKRSLNTGSIRTVFFCIDSYFEKYRDKYEIFKSYQFNSSLNQFPLPTNDKFYYVCTSALTYIEKPKTIIIEQPFSLVNNDLW